MSAGPHDFLFEALERTFDDGTRRAVPVIGAGLHYHLKGKAPRPGDDWDHFTNWNGLLGTVAKHFELPVVLHDDPASTWESLISRASAFKKTKAAKASGEKDHVGRAELEALRILASKLATPPATEGSVKSLGRGLIHFRDIISLNIDDTLGISVRSTGATTETPRVKDRMISLSQRVNWNTSKAAGRIWHPHGHHGQPDHIVLGTREYGLALSRLPKAWDCGKAAERAHRSEKGFSSWTPQIASSWWARRRGATPFEPYQKDGVTHYRLTWMDLFMGSDLIFLGTTLDRAEADLWWALHMRQRNLARIPPSERPGTFALYEQGQCPPHLTTGPAGVTAVQFQTWQEAWDVLLSD